jgi:hypothetical protein
MFFDWAMEPGAAGEDIVAGVRGDLRRLVGVGGVGG